MKDFYRQKGAGTRMSYQAKKVDWSWQGHFRLGDGRGLSGRLPN